MRDIRGETMYFAFVDRFVDGDPASNEGRDPATYDPERKDWTRYWGGDLQGVIDKLDYLERLGVSTIVLTPIVEQIPGLGRDRGLQSAPYHGAWAIDFRRLDPHLIPRQEWDRPFADRDGVFDRLVKACHARKMRLVLQFVCGQTNPGGTGGTARGEIHDDGRWLASYDQDPQGWYRHVLARETTGREAVDAGGAPFDPATSGMRAWMRSVLTDWLDRGADGLYFDMANSMPLWFWQEVASSVLYAKPDALLTGGWNGRSWDDTTVAFANRSGLRSTDFAFQRSVIEGLCWDEVGGFRRIASYLDRDEHLEDATCLVTSLDDARVPRLLSSGLRPDQLLLAVTLLMTTRGVPLVFYGTEQGLHCEGEDVGEPYNRPMMERFDDNPVTEAMWKLAALRKDNLAVQRGLYRTLWVNEDALVFVRSHGTDRIVVGLNRGRDVTMDLSDVPLPDGPAFDVLGSGGVLVRDKKIERFHLRAGGAVVLAHTLQRESAGRSVLCRLSGYRSRFGESVVVTGNVPELGSWDLARAVPLSFVNANLWMGSVSFERSLGKPVLYKYAVVDQRGAAVREDRLARRRMVPTCCGLEWADRWGTDG
ncbi:MAG: hypothetical protein HY898_15925 [Deltaproteobacteria bacterium]|nr:hypothetical protein [Deltaproteobacteria bacterium]